METPLYQIVARTPDGITRIVEVANTALTVGSDETCDLPLPVEFAEPMHLRLAPLPGRGVLLVNLAANGRTRVEGAAVERASSMVWEVNQVVDIGGVLLRLLPLPPPATAKPVKVVATVRDTNATAVEDGLLAPAEENLTPTPLQRSGALEESSEEGAHEESETSQDPSELPASAHKPPVEDPGLPSPSGTPRSGEGQGVRAGIDEPFPHLPRLPDEDDEPPTLLGDEDDDATPDKPLPAVVAPIPVMPSVGAQSVGAQSIAPLPSPVPVPAPQPSAERHTDAHEERTRMTEIYMGAIPDEVAYVRPRETRGYETLVKDWHYAGTLGLQMTMREVRLAQGERVRVPFSVSNDGVEPLQVQVYVTGLPEAWIGLSSAPLALNPGEVRLIDLMLHPHEGAPAQALSAAIYAHDVNAPHAKVSSTFQVTIKAQRDVVGWLQPVTAQAPGMTELVLQNHTQATAHIFLSSGSGDERLRVAFDRHDLQLPAGETVRVPVRLHVARRPLWVGRQAGLYVSVKAGSRAAIVYEAVARIRPRIGWTWLVILLLGLVAAALIAVYVRGV